MINLIKSTAIKQMDSLLNQYPTTTEAALLIGLDSHGLAVARALAKSGVAVYVIEQNSTLSGIRSKAVVEVFYVQDFEPNSLIEGLIHVREKLKSYSIIVLFPMNDRHVKIIGENILLLQSKYKILWGHCVESILNLQRKDYLESVCIERNLNYPRSVIFSAISDHINIENFQYPVILKPVRPLSSFKTILVNNFSEIESVLQKKELDLPIIGQEYINGTDSDIFFCQLMLTHGKILFGITGRKLLSSPPGQGQATAAETIEVPDVRYLAEKFFADFDLSGSAAIEFKRDHLGKYWVIEPTIGRTEFLVELCISAGFNQPLMEFQIATHRSVILPTELSPCIWYDTERDPAVFAAICWRTKSLKPYGKKPVFPYFGHGDISPLIEAWRKLIAMISKRFIRMPKIKTTPNKTSK